MFVDTLLVFDHLQHNIKVVSHVRTDGDIDASYRQASWKIEELTLRGIQFPAPMVTELARRTAGADATGAVPLRVSPAFQQVVIHPTGVILFRHRRSGGGG